MTIFEALTWLVLGAPRGVLVAACWRTEGLTFLRSMGVGAPGASWAGTMGAVTPALLFAGLGAVVTVLLTARAALHLERALRGHRPPAPARTA